MAQENQFIGLLEYKMRQIFQKVCSVTLSLDAYSRTKYSEISVTATYIFAQLKF